MADQDSFLVKRTKSSVCSTSQLDVEKTTSSSRLKKQAHRNNASYSRQNHRQKDQGGGASNQLAAPPKQESTFSNFKGGSFSPPPPDWLLLGLDQPTDVHLPPSLKPFPSHSPDIISSLLSPHNSRSGSGLVGDVGMNLIQQSQEEERGDYARGRHEIVLGNATITVYYVESPSHNR